jgi:hypothetical protein
VTTTHVEVGAYALGSLRTDDIENFEGHLDTCATCLAELEWLGQVVRLMATVPYTESLMSDTPNPDAAFAGAMLPEAS